VAFFYYMLKWIVIFIEMVIGVMITSLGVTMFLYGLISFFIIFERNAIFNRIGWYLFFIGMPVTALGIYMLRKNWKYITGKESWYR
jgi:hypothetical protein